VTVVPAVVPVLLPSSGGSGTRSGLAVRTMVLVVVVLVTSAMTLVTVVSVEIVVVVVPTVVVRAARVRVAAVRAVTVTMRGSTKIRQASDTTASENWSRYGGPGGRDAWRRAREARVVVVVVEMVLHGQFGDAVRGEGGDVPRSGGTHSCGCERGPDDSDCAGRPGSGRSAGRYSGRRCASPGYRGKKDVTAPRLVVVVPDHLSGSIDYACQHCLRNETGGAGKPSSLDCADTRAARKSVETRRRKRIVNAESDAVRTGDGGESGHEVQETSLHTTRARGTDCECQQAPIVRHLCMWSDHRADQNAPARTSASVGALLSLARRAPLGGLARVCFSLGDAAAKGALAFGPRKPGERVVGVQFAASAGRADVLRPRRCRERSIASAATLGSSACSHSVLVSTGGQ